MGPGQEEPLECLEPGEVLQTGVCHLRTGQVETSEPFEPGEVLQTGVCHLRMGQVEVSEGKTSKSTDVADRRAVQVELGEGKSGQRRNVHESSPIAQVERGVLPVAGGPGYVFEAGVALLEGLRYGGELSIQQILSVVLRQPPAPDADLLLIPSSAQHRHLAVYPNQDSRHCGPLPIRPRAFLLRRACRHRPGQRTDKEHPQQALHTSLPR